MPVFPLSGPIQLVVRAGAGSVTVLAHDSLAEAAVELEALGTDASVVEQTAVHLRGSVLVVHAPRQGGIFGRRSDQAMAIRVTVPAGTRVKIGTFTASVTTDGRLGSCDVAFGAADASLDEVDGDLRLRYGSGSARAGHVHGNAFVRAGAGDLALDAVDGDLRCGGGSGGLHVGRAGGAVHARTGAGPASLDAVHGDVDLVSGSGPLRIGLPAEVDAHVDAATGSGTVHSDLPVSDTPSGGHRAITVRARTGSGDVHLFRAA